MNTRINSNIKSNLMHYAERFTVRSTVVKYMFQIFWRREVAPRRSPVAALIAASLSQVIIVESQRQRRVVLSPFPCIKAPFPQQEKTIMVIMCCRPTQHVPAWNNETWCRNEGPRVFLLTRTCEMNCPNIHFCRNDRDFKWLQRLGRLPRTCSWHLPGMNESCPE